MHLHFSAIMFSRTRFQIVFNGAHLQLLGTGFILKKNAYQKNTSGICEIMPLMSLSVLYYITNHEEQLRVSITIDTC